MSMVLEKQLAKDIFGWDKLAGRLPLDCSRHLAPLDEEQDPNPSDALTAGMP